MIKSKKPVLVFLALFALLLTAVGASAQCTEYSSYVMDGEEKLDNYCSNHNTVQEYVCGPEGVELKGKYCELGCNNGACVVEEPVALPCTDSDPTQDRYVVGTLNDLYGDEYADVCESSNIIKQYSCDNIGRAAENFNRCANGCQDGRCLTNEEVKLDCNDPDGEDYFTKGTSYDTTGREHVDHCDSTRRLDEWVCRDGELVEERVYCRAECSSGACRIGNTLRVMCENEGQVICYDGWIETCVNGRWAYSDCTAECNENGCVEPTLAEPVTQPTPVAKPVSEPVLEPVAVEPVVEEPIAEPVVEPVAEPVAEPVVEPVAEPVVEPVAEPMPEPEVVKKSLLNKFFSWVNSKLFG